MSSCRLTRVLGSAAGGLLAAAALTLTTSATANADPTDVTTEVLGVSPYTDTIASDPDYFASDNFLSLPGFENEFYTDPNTNTVADIMTIPGIMQEVWVLGPESPGEPLDGFEFYPILNLEDFYSPDYFFVTDGF